MLLPCIAAGGAEPYFCTGEGCVLRYVRRYADSGKVRWRQTLRIEEVSPAEEGSMDVLYTSDIKEDNGKQMYGGPISLRTRVLPSGDIEMNMGETACAIFRNIFPRARNSFTGGEALLPSDAKPGDTHPDVHSIVRTLLGATYHIDITEREVVGQERLSTPAGDFECLVTKEHKSEKGPGRNRVTTSYTWYARGVGMIRHDTYIKGKLDTSEVLESIEK